MMRFLLALVFSTGAIAQQPSVERQQELQNMLQHDCGSCHGLTFKGGLGAPLTAKSLQNKNTAFLISTILEGREGTAMPPWKQFLTEQDALWIVQQLRKN